MIYSFRIETNDGDFFAEVRASRKEVARRRLFKYLLDLQHPTPEGTMRFQFSGVHDHKGPLPSNRDRRITGIDRQAGEPEISWLAGRAVWGKIGLADVFDDIKAKREAAN